MTEVQARERSWWYEDEHLVHRRRDGTVVRMGMYCRHEDDEGPRPRIRS